MKINSTRLEGLFTIELEKQEDDRGFFARTWDITKFKEFRLDTKLVQCNVSVSRKKGTLRGIHYQSKPYEETKLIRCTKGSIFDVVIDLRPKSKTFKKWQSFELNEKNYKMLYVPKGFAHGFITLQDNTEVFYQISEFFMPECVMGVRWDDPAFKIKWPLKPIIISEKDRNYEFFNDKIIR